VYHYKAVPGNGCLMLTKAVREAVPLGVSLALAYGMKNCMIITGQSRKWSSQPASKYLHSGLKKKLNLYMFKGGTRWRSWVSHCAKSRKVAGSITDGVIGIFYWHNTSDRTMVLGLTQSLTEMSTRNIPWRLKVAGARGWRPYQLHVPIILKSGSLKFLEPSGPLQACRGIALSFYTPSNVSYKKA